MIQLMLIFLAVGGGPTSDQHGKIHLPDQPGEALTILDFAASWCKPCWKALPRLQKLAEQRPGLNILVISQDSEAAGRDKLVKKLGLTMPVIWDQGHVWAQKYQPKAMPTTMIVDKSGKILYSHGGSSAKDQKQFLEALERIEKDQKDGPRGG